MKFTAVISTLAVAALLTWMPAPAAAQGPASAAGGKRVYDASTVETVRGEVLEVEHLPAKYKGGRSGGVHLQLKTKKETIPVHLGPLWYVDKQGVEINKGDQVEVRGSRVKLGGETVIIAAEVKKSGATMKLRDQQGLPLWRRGRR